MESRTATAAHHGEVDVKVGTEAGGGGDALGRVAVLLDGHHAAVAVAAAAGDGPLVRGVRLLNIHAHEPRPAL